MGGYMRKVNDK
ncbi:Protein of unknown function [Weissella confusa LBAE C39-2]|nr:Protein of unknown function [Weissella confusa LBAE C39-2]